MMSRVAFSPTCIWVTPSSQPGERSLLASNVLSLVARKGGGGRVWGSRTLDDLANANLDDKVAAANGRVEPEEGKVSYGRSFNDEKAGWVLTWRPCCRAWTRP